MIKKYIEFINENIDLPELKSWDDLIDVLKSGDSHKYNSRRLTENEKELLDEYCKKFEKVFLLTHEQINEVLLDLDLIDNLDITITNTLIRVIDGKDEGSTDFNFRYEVKDDIRGILNLKRWYDSFIGYTIRPIHFINIEKSPKAPFNHEEVYKYLEMVKETFEELCECQVKLDKGGPYSIQFKIEYPETTIE